MKTWITADWHLGEDRMAIMQRPFISADDNISVIVANHNNLVASDDLVYVLGDACNQNAPNELSTIAELSGRKILVRGNHDRVFSDEQLKPYFEQIIPEGEGIELEVNGLPVYLTHYPSRGRADRFNLVGHIHSAWKVQLNMLNVGVDVHSFRPIQLEQVSFFHKAISEFYDNDVWVAYNSINASHRETRGKKSTYFTK